MPIPVVFWRYGAKIRARSSFAPTAKAQPMLAAADEEDGETSGGGEK